MVTIQCGTVWENAAIGDGFRYSLAASISFIEFFHESLEQGKTILRSGIEGSAYSSRVRAHECIMLDCPWYPSLLSRTIRASELGLRLSSEKAKLIFLLTIALFMGTVPSRQLRAVDGHPVGSPWIVLRIFLCTLSSIMSSVFV